MPKNFPSFSSKKKCSPANLKGEFGGRIFAISEKSANSQSTIYSTQKILPLAGGDLRLVSKSFLWLKLFYSRKRHLAMLDS